MALVYGVATGGTTTLATGNALRCDEALLRIGIDLGPEFDALSAELPISTGHERRWCPVTRELFSACGSLGPEPDGDPEAGRLRDDAPGVAGAFWGVRLAPSGTAGNIFARRSRAVLACFQSAKVKRLILADAGTTPGRATGVLVRLRRRPEFLAADLVVLAAGGLGTPAILGRSGLPTEERLFVDPVLCVAAPARWVPRGRRGADALLRERARSLRQSHSLLS